MIKPIAFYLPQFHPIPENDAWWGKGFTEWRNVAKARPNFEGHYQPHVPSELGFYDLRLPEVQRQQSALAKEHGLHAFCYYVYWFGGRRVLERPVDQLLEHPEIDFPYCVCWANENWTRTWDGQEKNVLLAQQHSPEDDAAFLEAMRPHLTDPRYLRVDDKPMLLVYRVDLFPDAKATAARWQAQARSWGLEGLHLCAVQFYGITDARAWGFDAAVEFPPHQLFGPQSVPDAPVVPTNPAFRGTVVDYRKVANEALARAPADYPWYRGVMVSWDNTARRQDTPHVFVNSGPAQYQEWLEGAVRFTRAHAPADRQFVFINAWNEWAEGAHLEPDMKFGRAWLEATRAALAAQPSLDDQLFERLRQVAPDTFAEVKRMLDARDRSIAAMRVALREKNAQLQQQARELDQLRQDPAKWAKEALREQVVRRPALETTLRTALHYWRKFDQR